MKTSEIKKLHGLYLCGMSAAKIAERHTNISGRALIGYFHRLNLKTRGKREKLNHITRKGVKYTKHKNTGVWRSTSGSRMNLSRVIWVENNGEIPNRHLVVHVDGDLDNLKIDNLKLISKVDHLKMFPRNNQHTKKVNDGTRI